MTIERLTKFSGRVAAPIPWTITNDPPSSFKCFTSSLTLVLATVSKFISMLPNEQVIIVFLKAFPFWFGCY